MIYIITNTTEPIERQYVAELDANNANDTKQTNCRMYNLRQIDKVCAPLAICM